MPSEEEYLDQLLKGITEPVIEEPVIEEPVIEEPVIEEPVIEEPVIVEPVIEEPVIEEPIYEEPVIQEPIFDELLSGESIEETSIIEELATEEAVIEELDTEESVTEELAIENEDFGDDDILKKMVLENATLEDVLQDDIFEEELDVEDSDAMTEEEIELLLEANQSDISVDDSFATIAENEDLMSLLEEASDNELQDIYDMLSKSDNNEAVDEEMLNLLGGVDSDEAAKLQAELDAVDEGASDHTEVLTKRQEKALEKKRLREEKAEAKRAAKEAKKAEKEAKRIAKKAAKETARENEEAVAGSVEATETNIFEGIDDLSTEDMLDLQELLSVGNMQTASEEGFAGLNQESQVHFVPKIVETSDDNLETGSGLSAEPVSEDMLEIDELLSLAGISGVAEESVAVMELEETDAMAELLDENTAEVTMPKKEKKGLFTRILDFLTETDEEDEKEQGNENIPLSDENKSILDEMDKEGKSSGKKKGKKAKKGKKEQAELETVEENGEEGAAKGKKPAKAKKVKKPKKEKHLEVMPLEESKNKISVKAIISVGAVCATILAIVLVLVNLGGDFAVKREAKRAYYQEDYETCYQVLYGKKLNESEQVMFAKSESILRIRLRMRQYEMFVEEGSETKALDVCIRTVYDYAELYEYASKWNAEDEVSAVYGQMLGILQDKYNLTESDALEIAAEPDDVEYTKIVTAVAEGKAYDSLNEESVSVENLPDMLPEELQFPENNGGQ